jgi:hypothetical protein
MSRLDFDAANEVWNFINFPPKKGGGVTAVNEDFVASLRRIYKILVSTRIVKFCWVLTSLFAVLLDVPLPHPCATAVKTSPGLQQLKEPPSFQKNSFL